MVQLPHYYLEYDIVKLCTFYPSLEGVKVNLTIGGMSTYRQDK